MVLLVNVIILKIYLQALILFLSEHMYKILLTFA